MTTPEQPSRAPGTLQPMPVPPSGRQVELVHGDQRAVVVEVGGGLRTYARGKWDVLDGYGEAEMCTGGRGQVLLPWPNRIQDGRYAFGGREYQLPLTEPDKHNALHGLTRWANWSVAEQAADRATMEYVLHPQDGYPFALHLSVAYALEDRGLSATTTARNVGAERCPYGAGAHPYVSVGTSTIDGAIVRAPGRSWMPVDGREIPIAVEPADGTAYDYRRPRAIGAADLDTCFTDLERDGDGLARVVVEHPDASRRVTVWLGDRYRYLMLFTGDTLPDASQRRRGLAVEPMTCPPNAFASGDGVIALEPGEATSATWGISPELGT